MSPKAAWQSLLRTVLTRQRVWIPCFETVIGCRCHSACCDCALWRCIAPSCALNFASNAALLAAMPCHCAWLAAAASVATMAAAILLKVLPVLLNVSLNFASREPFSRCLCRDRRCRPACGHDGVGWRVTRGYARRRDNQQASLA